MENKVVLFPTKPALQVWIMAPGEGCRNIRAVKSGSTGWIAPEVAVALFGV
jgi:hypothetical protein